MWKGKGMEMLGPTGYAWARIGSIFREAVQAGLQSSLQRSDRSSSCRCSLGSGDSGCSVWAAQAQAVRVAVAAAQEQDASALAHRTFDRLKEVASPTAELSIAI